MHGALAHLRFWWDYRRSAVIAVLVSVAIVCIIVIIVASVTLPSKSPTESARPTCNTSDCVTMAQRLGDSMNTSVDPCEDFYLFACQRWDSVRNVSIWQSASDHIQADVVHAKEALMNGWSPTTEKAEKYFADFIQHCLKDDSKKDAVLTELERLGGYPLFGIQRDDFNWLEAEAHLAHINHNQAIFLVRFDINPREKNKRIIRIGHQPSMFPNSFLENSSAVKGLKAFLYDVSHAYRQSLGHAATHGTEHDINDQILSLLNFTKNINQILQDSRQKVPEIMTIANLSRAAPEVDWLMYFNILSNPIINEITVRDSDLIIVQDIDTLSRLTALIGKREHQRDVANYIGYKFIINSIFFSPQASALRTFYDYSAAHAAKFDRKNKCKELAETLKLVYYHHYFKANLKKFKEPRDLVLGMLHDVTKQLQSAMESAEWIDDHTRNLLLRKLKRIQHFVGYSDWLLNGDNVYNFYDMGGAPGRSKPFLERLAYHRMRLYRKQTRELNASRSPEIWDDITAEVINAAFQIRDINVKVYAGMLLKPFIFRRAPRYVNYGTVGFVAGHEIIHAFDDRGTTIDEYGVDFETDPWPSATRQEFKRRMNSIISFYEDEFMINGSYTRNENLADMSAIRFSFKAYKNYTNSEMEPVLPGFEGYTNDQLYFLSFASIWCNNNKYDNRSIHGPHSSRVNGPLMNLQEFSDTYKCPAGSRMNPEDKKIVWG